MMMMMMMTFDLEVITDNLCLNSQLYDGKFTVRMLYKQSY